MSGDVDVVTVTIEPDISGFVTGIERALDALRPLLWRVALAGQRDRSRLVTRRKQRRSW